MSAKTLRCAILFSGRGGNLKAIANAVDVHQLPIKIVAAICNKPAALGLQYALEYALPTWIIDHQQLDTQTAFEDRIQAVIDASQVDLIILAGFMRRLSKVFVERYQNHMINLHPSLLPLYPGLNTHARVIDNGDSEHGASVHFVTPELDAGPVIAQYRMPVDCTDAVKLAERLIPHEQRLLLAVIALFSDGRVVSYNNRVIVDNQALLRPLRLDQDLHW